MAKGEIEVLERKDGRIVMARTIKTLHAPSLPRPASGPRAMAQGAATTGQGIRRTGKTARDRQKRLERGGHGPGSRYR